MGPEPVLDSKVAGMHIWGWMTEPELLWLGDQAEQMDSVVEVGTLRGRSAFMLMTRCKGPVYCIDGWADPGGHCFRGFMEACGHFDNLRAVQGWSPQIAADVPDADMVFLDGDHAYDQVVADLDAWLPKTRRLICGHDYSDQAATWDLDGEPGVWNAVHERFGSQQIVHPDLTSIWAVWL